MTTTDTERALAALALDHHLLSPERAVTLIDAAAGDGPRLVRSLLAEIPEAGLLAALAQELGLDYYDLYGTHTGLRVDQGVLNQVPMPFLRTHSAIPMLNEDDQVVVVVANPADLDLRTHFATLFPGLKIGLAARGQIQAKLALSTSMVFLEPETPLATATSTAPLVAPTPRNPLVAWVDNVRETAVAQNTSDVHLEFNGDGTMLLRFRIDGVLRLHPSPLRGRELEVIGILMNRAGMDSANQREPQDGTFSFVASARKIDVRAAMLPQENGTSMVLRLLDSANVSRRLSDMGFNASQLETMERAASSSQGTVIVCGPTGSGKTTTLYAMLREMASIEKNVVTIENPVEYRLPLINQTSVNTGGDRDFGFTKALRAILRMDPDVILVGEIRDAETAKTAMDAAITGHLVLSTVHARDAVGIYTRLAEMGVPAYLVAEAMSVGVSQRLVRRLHDCAQLVTPTTTDLAMYHAAGTPAPDQILRPAGCPGCSNSGYRGRLAVVEVLEPSLTFRQKVLLGAGHDELAEQARADGMVSMMDEGLRLVRDQMTTVEELLRTVSG